MNVPLHGDIEIKPVMDMHLTMPTPIEFFPKTLDILSTIKVVYLVRGKSMQKRLFSADGRAREVMEKID